MTAKADSMMVGLRSVLREAQADGVIDSWALRAGGRATLYLPGGEAKRYTTGTLDTLAALERLRKEATP